MKRHPQLARKFELLYSLRLNPTIKSHADLAELLGISRQAVGRWARGTETSQGDSIPLSQLQNVSAIFGIEDHWFSQEYDEFEANVYGKREASGFADGNALEKISVSLLPITPAKIFGRKLELKTLDDAWKSSKTNVLQLVGFGGIGKSSLINSWLSRLDQKGYVGARRVYAWSFYWQAAGSEVRSSGDYFIEHALSWFGDDDPLGGTPWARATRLANLIREKRTLLILDGLEPMQVAPGPKQGQIDNPAVSLLVKELASRMNGLCVITSRLMTSDLAAYEGARLKVITLERLPQKACIKMLRSLGVQGRHEEFVSAIEDYAGHPLSISLLGGYVNVVYKGRIGEYSKIRSLMDEQSLGGHAASLMKKYLDWFKGSPECALLYLVGLFDRSVSFSHLELIVKLNPEIDGLTADLESLTLAQLNYAIDKLTRSNLLLKTEIDSELILDCHPLVRDYISDYLRKSNSQIWTKGHTLIFEFLQKITVKNPESMSQLEPLFRAVIHGTQAGLYSEAFSLYFEKIKRRYTMLTAGSHHIDQLCIMAFNEEDSAEPTKLLPQDARYHLLASSATNLIALGRLGEAICPSEKCLDWFIENKFWLEAVNLAGPYVSMLIISGRLEQAMKVIRQVKICVAKVKNEVILAMYNNFQAFILHLEGKSEAAIALFEISDKALVKSTPSEPVGFPTVSSYYCRCLLESGLPAEALERSLKTFAWRSNKSWQVAIDTTSLLASDMQVLGLVFLELGDRINAKVYLDKQINLLKEADEWLYLPSGLNARARYFTKVGDYQAAESDLNLALQISKRTGAKFNEWETYLNLASLSLAKDDSDMCRVWLDKLETLPGMDAYKFRDREITTLKDRLSAANDDTKSGSTRIHKD